MATRTNFQKRPVWGAYSNSHIGAYYILDSVNQYGLSFPVSIKVGNKRFNGKYNDSSDDSLFYCDRYCPSGDYWRTIFPFDVFGSYSGSATVEFFKYSSTALGIKVVLQNTSASPIDIETSVLGFAHAKMNSYSSGFIQNDIDHASASKYVGMSWTSQSTRVCVIKSDSTISHQDIQDTDFSNGLSSLSDPFIGDGLGRSVRAKNVSTILANSSVTLYFAISVNTDESAASTEASAAITNANTTLSNLVSRYDIWKSPLCKTTPYGSLVEKTLATVLHNLVYDIFSGDTDWKFQLAASRKYTGDYYSWDTAFLTLSLAEAGYVDIAIEELAYPFDTSGNFIYNVRYSPDPWPFVVWRIWELMGRKGTLLADYYPSLKAAYLQHKTDRIYSGSYRWPKNYHSGMENLVAFSDPSSGGADNTNITPDAIAWMAQNAYYLKKMATVQNISADITEYTDDITSYETLLENCYNSSDGWYWPIQSDTNFKKTKTIASVEVLLYPALRSDRVDKVVLMLNNLISNGEVLVANPYTTDWWGGDSWCVTNFIIQKGLRDNGYLNIAKGLESSSVANWDGVYDHPFREVRKPDGTMGATRQFISFPSLLCCMVKNSLVKRKLV